MEVDFRDISLQDLASLVYEKFRQHNLSSILVGGACVSIYSHNEYQSYDLDFITYDDMKLISKALSELGFVKEGKHYFHPQCPFFIDFVSPPVAIGNEPVNHFSTIKGTLGSVKLLTPTDCVKDRLSNYYHWDDQQSLEQAVLVAQDQEIDIQKIKKWSEGEENLKKFETFLELFIKSRK